MLIRSFLFLLLMSIATHSSAVLIDTSIGKYDVTTIIGGYDIFPAVLQDTPWWSDSTLAIEFASLSQSAGLLSPDPSYNFSIDLGPLFQYAPDLARAYRSGSVGNFGTSLINDSTNVVFAVATKAVPEPSSIALLAIGLFGIGLVRRRQS